MTTTTTRPHPVTASRGIALMQEVLAFIEEHPAMHNQGHWVGKTQPTEENTCGTTACFAGWTVFLAGYEPVDGYHSDEAIAVFDGDPLLEEGAQVVFGDQPDGQHAVHIRYAAATLLGMEPHDTGWLFDGNLTIDDLRLRVKRRALGLDVHTGEPV